MDFEAHEERHRFPTASAVWKTAIGKLEYLARNRLVSDIDPRSPASREKPADRESALEKLDFDFYLRTYANMNVFEMQESADRAVALLKALASRNRLMILCILVEGERSVGALAQDLELREPLVSQHLALLRRDGLVRARRDGQTIYYALAGDEASRVLATLYAIYCSDDSTREPLHDSTD